MDREVLAGMRVADISLKFALCPIVLRVTTRGVRVCQPRTIQVEEADYSEAIFACQETFCPEGEIFPAVSGPIKLHRGDSNGPSDPRIQPTLEERGQSPSFGVAFHEQDELHDTASASPEKQNLPSE